MNIPLIEYPRPQMRRSAYEILNGEWEYAFRESGDVPAAYDGRILVPFSPEAPGSGVSRRLEPGGFLHYHRTFSVDAVKIRAGHLLLHFGAVDERCTVYVNSVKVGTHRGGYLAFSFDITGAVHGGENELHVVVQDDTDTSYHARGKQKLLPGGMYYTMQSGIWQTVWMEYVPEKYIADIKWTPDLSAGGIRVTVRTAGAGYADRSREQGKEEIVKVKFRGPADHSKMQSAHTILSDCENFIPIEHPHLWSPEDPYLYRVELTLMTQDVEERAWDVVRSYFAMRSFGVGYDEREVLRFLLNGKPYFQSGVLDQGYWPQGLMTAPSDQAMKQDIVRMKKLGFNMLRKHVKIEPLRWYYHCDRLGMLVWQDTVNGGRTYSDQLVTVLPNIFPALQSKIRDDGEPGYRMLRRQDSKGRSEYEEQLSGMIHQLYNAASICTWVPFNEGWGQFDAVRITEQMKEMDPTRLVDSASGWFDQKTGDYHSVHNYFRTLKTRKSDRIEALTEFGGYSRLMDGSDGKNGMAAYRKFDSEKALTDAYEKLIRRDILRNLDRGLCVSIYTQLSDIEEEVNGLLTYDRSQLKMDAARVRRLNLLVKKRFEKYSRM